MSAVAEGGEEPQNEDVVLETKDKLNSAVENSEFLNDSDSTLEESMEGGEESGDPSSFLEDEEDEMMYEQEGDDEYDEEAEIGGVDEEAEETLEGSVVPGSADDLMQHMNDDSSDDSNDSLYEKESSFDLRGHKNALKGFTDEDQNRIFPMVDEQSQALFELVQELEDEQLKSSERALLETKMPVAIPSHHLAVNQGGPEIKLRILDDAALALAGSQNEEADEELPVKGQKKGKHKQSSTPAIVTNVTDVPERILAALPTDLFTREKKALLMKTLESGWKREIVMRSNCHPGKKMGDVYYFSPDGVKFRSSKQVALYLGKKPQLGLSVDNFSFAKARVSFDPSQETIRQAYSGKASTPSPVKSQSSGGSSPVKPVETDVPEASGVVSDQQQEEGESQPAGGIARASSSRRSIQPPKRYATADSVYFTEKKPKLAANSKTVNVSNEMEQGGMEMGMLPPKYPRDMEESYSKGSAAGLGGAGGGAGKSGLGSIGAGSAANDYPVGRRGRPPKHGGKRQLIPQSRAAEKAVTGNDSRNSVDDEDAEGPMFGISALTRASYGPPFASPTGGFRGSNFEGVSSEDVNDDGEVRNQNEEGLQPCSIRCPGMSGDIPTLQCRRCLCLYHPQCLGLPNQNYKNFFCANCEDDDASGDGQQQQRHQDHRAAPSRNSMNVHHNLPQQHHRQQQMQNDQRIRLMRGGYGRRPPPSLIRMQGRPPSLPQHHLGQQQSQMMSHMRGLDPRKLMMKGSSGTPRGSGLQLGRGTGGLRNPMRLELPKLNLRPILKRSAMSGGSSELGGGLPRGMGLGGFGRGRGRPPRTGGAAGTGINLPQFLKNNRINSGGAVTITPIGLHPATQSNLRKMGGVGPSAGGSGSHLSVPKLPMMRPIRASLGGDGSRMPNQRTMRGGMINRGGRGHGMVMAAPYRLLKPKMPFTEPEGDESLQQVQISMSAGSSSKMNANSGAAQRVGVVGQRGYPQGVVIVGDKKYIAVKQPYKSTPTTKTEGEQTNDNPSTSAAGEDRDVPDTVDEASPEESNENKDIADLSSTDIGQDAASAESKDNVDLKNQNNIASGEDTGDRNDHGLESASEAESKDVADLNSCREIDQENITTDGNDGETLDSKILEVSEIKAL